MTYRIAKYTDGTSVQEGDRIRFKQASGGILPPSEEWRYGVARPDRRNPEVQELHAAYAARMGIDFNRDELYLFDDGRYFNIVGHIVERAQIQIGALVDAEYIANSYGTIAKMRGIVTYIGDWEGKPTYSVQGVGAATSQNTMPVHLIAPALSDEARAFVDAVTLETSRDRMYRAEQKAATLAESKEARA